MSDHVLKGYHMGLGSMHNEQSWKNNAMSETINGNATEKLENSVIVNVGRNRHKETTRDGLCRFNKRPSQ